MAVADEGDEPVAAPPQMKRRLAGSMGWVALLQIGQRGFELLFTAVLARLLTPADFGVVAAAMIFIQFAQLLVEIGIGATLVQIRNLSERDLRAANTLIFTSAVGYCLITVAVAPWAGEALRIDAVVPVLRVLALIFVFQAIGIVSESLLIRRLEARTVMMVQFVAKLIGTGGFGIALALLGWNYWALVVATLVETLVKALALAIIVRPPLRPLFSRELSKQLLGRGSGFSASKLLNFVALRGDKALVGRYLDAASLGLYSRAYSLMSLPADLYTTIADRLVFPAMAQVQDDLPRLRRAFLHGTELTALAGMPLSVILYLLAPEVIDLVLGAQWHAVIVPFGVLAAATYFRLGAKVGASVQRARGAFRAMIVTQGIYAALVVGGCLATLSMGIAWVAASISLGVTAFYVILSWNSCRIVGVGAGEFLRAHGPGLALGVLTALLCWPVVALSRDAGLGTVPTLGATGTALALGGGILLLARPRWLLGDLGSAAAGRAIAMVQARLRR